MESQVQRGGKNTLEKGGEDGKTTLGTSGEDHKTTLETSVFFRFVLDGFPRSVDQIKAFEKEVAPVAFVLYLEATEQVSEYNLLHSFRV